MLVAAPVELACRPGEQGRLCDRTAAVFDQVDRFGADAALVPAGLLYLCGKDAAHPVPSSVSTCERGFTRPVTIRGVGGHMHLLGRSIRVDLNPGTPRARLLLEIPRWNFHWQAVYQLAAPVQAGPGDVVRVTCRYDTGQRQHRSRGTCSGARGRPTRCASASSRSRRGSAPACASCSSRRCTPGLTRRSSAHSSRTSSSGSRGAGHELARAVVDRRRRTLAPRRAREGRRGHRAPVPPGRRVRALPRPGGPSRRHRGPRARGRHRARPGRRERPRLVGGSDGDAADDRPRGGRRRGVRLAAHPAGVRRSRRRAAESR